MKNYVRICIIVQLTEPGQQRKTELVNLTESLENELKHNLKTDYKHIQSMRKERDFYFNKLIAIEKVSDSFCKLTSSYARNIKTRDMHNTFEN